MSSNLNFNSMAKKIITNQPLQPTLHAFVCWYNVNINPHPSKVVGHNVLNNPPTGRQPLTPQQLKGILAALSLSNTKQNIQDVTDAYNFLMDNHQWYLNVSAVSARDQVIDILIKAKPWANTQLKNKPFVDLFQYFQNLLSPNGVLIKFIGQLTVYDLAMRIALMNSSALPTEVYVHAKPLIAAKQMAKKGYMSKFHAFVIPASDFVGAFGNMAPCDIEDLLCHIGKSIERVKDGVKGKNQAQIDIDKLTQQYL